MGIKAPLYNQMYLDKGEGDLIVILHGLFENLNDWAPVIAHLSKTHRVIIPRLPIFEVHHSTVYLTELCYILDAFLDLHQITNVTLVGHAAVGQLALSYALHQPKNVKRVIISSTSLPERASSAINEVDLKERETFRYTNQSTINVSNTERTGYESVESTHSSSANAQRRLSDSLYRIEQSVLLIWGLEDKITNPETALYFHDALPNSELKFIKHCGHYPSIEYPDLYNQYVTDFLLK